MEHECHGTCVPEVVCKCHGVCVPEVVCKCHGVCVTEAVHRYHGTVYKRTIFGSQFLHTTLLKQGSSCCFFHAVYSGLAAHKCPNLLSLPWSFGRVLGLQVLTTLSGFFMQVPGIKLRSRGMRGKCVAKELSCLISNFIIIIIINF